MRLTRYLNESKEKEIIMLVGLPASGKSTFIKKLKGNYVIISNDEYVERKAKQAGLSYTEMWPKLTGEEVFGNTKIEFNKAISQRKNIVIDNTNMVKRDRKFFVKNKPEDYKLKAYIFDVKYSKKLQDRNDKRAKEMGKDIPVEVYKRMEHDYTPPTKEEGFDEIKKIS